MLFRSHTHTHTHTQHEVNKFDLVMEADLGTFRPWGIQFTGTDAAMDIMKSIGPLLQSINASLVTTVNTPPFFPSPFFWCGYSYCIFFAI